MFFQHAVLCAELVNKLQRHPSSGRDDIKVSLDFCVASQLTVDLRTEPPDSSAGMAGPAAGAAGRNRPRLLQEVCQSPALT